MGPNNQAPVPAGSKWARVLAPKDLYGACARVKRPAPGSDPDPEGPSEPGPRPDGSGPRPIWTHLGILKIGKLGFLDFWASEAWGLSQSLLEVRGRSRFWPR